MADVKISALPAASTPLTGGEVLPVVQSGVTTKVAVSNLTAGLAGTASININGTVGATTPTTGAFTSGTFSTTLGVTGNISTNGIAIIKGQLLADQTSALVMSQITSSFSRIFAYGPNPATAGGVDFRSVSSDGSIDTTLLTLAAGGAVTIPGTLGVTTGAAVGGATPGAGGIAFPATAVSVANVNTLDDYEEGTWSGAHASSVNFTGTPTLSNGRYTKIGNMVNVRGTISGTVTTANTLTYTVFGAPFTEAFRTSGAAFDNTNIKVGQSSAASSNIYLFFPAASAVPSGATEWDVNITYQV